MRTTKIVGLCLVAAFALSAFAMSATSAYAGEWGQCYKTEKAGKGKYSEKNCITRDEKKGKPKGNYEFRAGPSPSCVAVKKGEYTNSTCTTKASKKGKGKFEREKCYGGGSGCAEYKITSGEVVLEGVTSRSPIKCTSSKGEGIITSAKEGHQTLVLEGCSAAGGHVICTSEGASSGVIKTETLDAKLIDHGETGKGGLEPASGEIWNEYSGASEEVIAKFDCVGIGYFKVKGYVSGPISPVNVSTTISTQTLKEGVAEQGTETEVCRNAAYTECGAYEKGIQTVTEPRSTFNEEVEART